jgi:hypothetical protein
MEIVAGNEQIRFPALLSPNAFPVSKNAGAKA